MMLVPLVSKTLAISNLRIAMIHKSLIIISILHSVTRDTKLLAFKNVTNKTFDYIIHLYIHRSNTITKNLETIGLLLE